MLFILVILFCNLYAQKDSVENVRLFPKPEPDLITQATRIQAAAHMQTHRGMVQDEDLEQDALLACLCCTAIIGGTVGYYVIPPSWDFSGDKAPSSAKLGATLAMGPTLYLLTKPTIARKVNSAYKALIGKAD